MQRVFPKPKDSLICYLLQVNSLNCETKNKSLTETLRTCFETECIMTQGDLPVPTSKVVDFGTDSSVYVTSSSSSIIPYLASF